MASLSGRPVMNDRIVIAPLLLLFWFAAICSAVAQTAITYQGQIQADGVPYSGPAELIFALYDHVESGDQVAGPLVESEVPVVDGLFQVELDFGAVYATGPLYLQISLDGQPLSPRQAITTVPVAVHALGVELQGGDGIQVTGNTLSLGPCPAGQIWVSTGTGWNCAANEDQGGSPAYLHASPDESQDADMDISGDATIGGTLRAESVRAVTSFDEALPPSAYPTGVSWQTGQGANAPVNSACQDGIVQTMFFNVCRVAQICLERGGLKRFRHPPSPCNIEAWGDWTDLQNVSP